MELFYPFLFEESVLKNSRIDSSPRLYGTKYTSQIFLDTIVKIVRDKLQECKDFVRLVQPLDLTFDDIVASGASISDPLKRFEFHRRYFREDNGSYSLKEVYIGPEEAAKFHKEGHWGYGCGHRKSIRLEPLKWKNGLLVQDWWDTGIPKRLWFGSNKEFTGVEDEFPTVVRFDRDGNIIEMEWMYDDISHRSNGPAIIKFHPNGRILSESWLIAGYSWRVGDGATTIYYDDQGNIIREEDVRDSIVEWFYDSENPLAGKSFEIPDNYFI